MAQVPRKLTANFLLLCVVAVWGATFALVKSALADCTPLLFNEVRMLLAFAALAAVHMRSLRGLTRQGWRSGAVAGILLALGYELQTAGLARTTAAKSAFLTGTVIVLVPLFSAIPLLRRPGTQAPGWPAMTGVLPAFAGIVLLTTPAGTRFADLLTTISLGDGLSLLCAVAFAGHLLWLGRQAGSMPAAQLATLQIGVCAAVMAVVTPVLEQSHVHWSMHLLGTLLFMAVVATAAAFSIQTWAQQHLPPVNTALVLSLEPAFAWLVSVVFLHDRLGRRAVTGALLIFGGLLLAEVLPGRPVSEQPEGNLPAS